MQFKRWHTGFDLRRLMLCATLLAGSALVASVRAQTAVPGPGGATGPAPEQAATPVADAASKLRLSTAQIQQAFQYVDTDHNGSLSRKELSVFPRLERHFDRMDTNHDGVISPAEFEEALQQAS